MKPPKPFPFYPLLFAIFPVLSLLGHNIQELEAGAANRSLLVVVIGTLLVWGLWGLVTRSCAKSALLTAFFLLLFYTYGGVQNLSHGGNNFALFIGANYILLPIWTIVWVDGSYLIHKKFRYQENQIKIFNALSIFLLIMPIFQVVSYHVKMRDISMDGILQDGNFSPVDLVSPQNPPDIYLIVLDSYTREDVLKEMYGLDNQPFVNALSNLGFYVAPCSLSNYSHTPLSLSSMLNMDYHQNMDPAFPPKGYNDLPRYYELVKHNLVRANLEELGYKTVSIVAYQPIVWNDADVYYPTDPEYVASKKGVSYLTQFERMLGRKTVLKPLFDIAINRQYNLTIPSNYPYEDQVRIHWYLFEKLNEIIEIPGPKFVFIHINIPHPPFYFHADGSIIENPKILSWEGGIPWRDSMDEYAEAVEYVNSQILPFIEKLVQSDTPPMIILQGDHGYDVPNRLAILNAYFLPEAAMEKVYPDITPVNSFRIIFNEVFGGEYPILDDASYNSPLEFKYGIEEYHETMPGCMP